MCGAAHERRRPARSCALAGGLHLELLVICGPMAAVCPRQHKLTAATAGAQLAEEGGALVGEHDVPRLAGLDLPDRQRAGVRR